MFLKGRDLQMMITVQSYFQQFKVTLRRWSLNPEVHKRLRVLASLLSGFVLSAASLAHHPQPFATALVCMLTGVPSILTALGAAAGYLIFWSNAGWEGVMWAALALLCAQTLGRTHLPSRSPWLMSSTAGLITALSGLWMQHLGMGAEPAMYLLRIGLSIGTARLFAMVQDSRDTVADWVVSGIGVLALCQIAPISWLCLGFPAAAFLTTGFAFPAAALAGLALDLADVTAVPMTAALCVAWLVRLLPWQKPWARALAPAFVYPIVMVLTGNFDPTPLPGLAIGGLLGLLVPNAAPSIHRRGETGIAQVKLELTAEVFRQMQQLLLELNNPPIDEQALILRACEKACGTCSYRKSCTGKQHAQALSPQILSLPILDSSLHFSCRRTGRLLQELRRSQEHLRLLRSIHQQQEESRLALTQQYRFLSLYLQELSDDLGRRSRQYDLRYEPEVAFCANRSMAENGDRCLQFAGIGCRYYVAILDGMGTGFGALDEAAQAGSLLKHLLRAGFPAEHALSSLNSLCALRGRAGAVTVDLAELQLDTGKASLYKWGAPPSWLMTNETYEKIGTAGPPPGLLVASNPEEAQRLSLRRGEILVMLSDGVGGEDALTAASANAALSDQALEILTSGNGEGNDDATVALIRLRPRKLAP